MERVVLKPQHDFLVHAQKNRRGYVDEYFEKLIRRTAESTQRTDRSLLKRLLVHFGGIRLTKITTAHARDFAGEMSAEGKSPATVNAHMRLLIKLLRDAVDRECLDQVRIKGRIKLKVELPKLELTQAERERFLAAFDDENAFRQHLQKARTPGKPIASHHFGSPRVFGGPLSPDSQAAGYYFERFRWSKPLFVLALETGLRRSDILALKWDAIDLNQKTIKLTVRKTKERALIAISPACLEALTECRQRKVVASHVLLAPEGRPYSEGLIRHYFATAKRIAGITRRFRFHDLRHTFASNLAAQGVSLQLIQRQLGHTSITQTERYSRVSDEAVRELADFLSGEGGARTRSRTPGVGKGERDAS